MQKLLNLTLLICLSAGLFSFTLDTILPQDWIKAGSHPDAYEMGLDKKVRKIGKSSAFIESTTTSIEGGFGTLMQSCSAQKYWGKRVRMTAFVKSKNLSEWAGLWLRIDDKEGKKSVRFDNMGDRPIKGTTNWKKYSIELNVPAGASTMNYGALVAGTGKIWFDNLEIEVVANLDDSKRLDSPSNLDFEK